MSSPMPVHKVAAQTLELDGFYKSYWSSRRVLEWAVRSDYEKVL